MAGQLAQYFDHPGTAVGMAQLGGNGGARRPDAGRVEATMVPIGWLDVGGASMWLGTSEPEGESDADQ